MGAAARDDAEATAYLRAVERSFVKAAGRGLMLSARDVDRALRWHRAGYPIHIITETIEQVMAVAPPRVRGLAYAAPAIEESIERWSRRREGAASPIRPPSVSHEAAWQRLLDRLEEVGRVAQDPARSVLRLAWRLTDQAKAQCWADPTLDPVALLSAVEAQVEQLAIESLDLSVRQMIEARVDLSLAAERKIAAPSAFIETRRAHMWRAVRRRLKLPQLKLSFSDGDAR